MFCFLQCVTLTVLCYKQCTSRFLFCWNYSFSGYGPCASQLSKFNSFCSLYVCACTDTCVTVTYCYSLCLFKFLPSFFVRFLKGQKKVNLGSIRYILHNCRFQFLNILQNLESTGRSNIILTMLFFNNTLYFCYLILR